MKFTLKLIPLIIAILLAVSFGGTRCPLFTKGENEDHVFEQAGLVFKTKPLYTKIWRYYRTNGFWKFRVGEYDIYALDVESAVKKYIRKTGSYGASLLCIDSQTFLYQEIPC